MFHLRLLGVWALLFLPAVATAQESNQPPEGFESLFNGQDLGGVQIAAGRQQRPGRSLQPGAVPQPLDQAAGLSAAAGRSTPIDPSGPEQANGGCTASRCERPAPAPSL